MSYVGPDKYFGGRLSGGTPRTFLFRPFTDVIAILDFFWVLIFWLFALEDAASVPDHLPAPFVFLIAIAVLLFVGSAIVKKGPRYP